MPLQKVFDPFSDADADPPPYLPRLAAVIQLLMLLPAFLGRFVGAFAGTLQHGYFVLPGRKLEELMSEALADINVNLKERAPRVAWPRDAGAWLRQLNQVQPHTWPLRPGGILRRINQYLLIDITCASNALISGIEIGRSPGTGNVRAAAFEVQCQQVINDSRWRPDRRLLEVRGRTLQHDGKNLTDIDALGTNGRTLLLVSCKSIIYDGAYDKGEYRVVRNVQATVDEAVQHWSNFIDELRRTPSGDNFDFSAFEEIIGVVCTPFVAYTSHPVSLNFVAPNLRASVSSAELASWLSS